MKVVAGLLVAFTVFMMIFTIVTVTTVDKNDRSIFGIKFYIVQTDSMSLSDKNAHMDVHFNAGDIVLIKNVKEPTKLESGDIIAFMSTNDVSYGETVTHMIREPKMKNGKLEGYVTFGTNTDTNDEALVEPSYILGEYAGKLPGVGNFFAFVKSTKGYIVCILVPFLLLILYNLLNVIRLFRKYKSEQNEAMEAERAQIAAERQQNEDMLRQLQALQEQLAKQAADGAAQQPEAKTEETITVTEEAPAESAEANEAETASTPSESNSETN